MQDIDVVQLETLQAGLDRIEYMLGSSQVNEFPSILYHTSLTLRLRPRWLIIPYSSGLSGICKLGSFATGKKTYGESVLGPRCVTEVRRTSHTFVMMTSSSRGRLNCLIAFPRIISDRPLEYTCNSWISTSHRSLHLWRRTYIRSVECRDPIVIPNNLGQQWKMYTYRLPPPAVRTRI